MEWYSNKSRPCCSHIMTWMNTAKSEERLPHSYQSYKHINAQLICCDNLSLGRLSTRFWNVAAGICSHSGTRAWVKPGADVGDKGWLRSGPCAGQSRMENHFVIDMALSQWNRKGSSQSWKHTVVKQFCARALRFAFVEIKGQTSTLQTRSPHTFANIVY